MYWSYLGLIIESAILLWFAGLVAIVAVQMTNGQIIVAGMLKRRRTGRFKFHRLQMLAMTLLFAGVYLLKALTLAPGEGLPNVPVLLLLTLFGSQATFLAGKALER